MKVHELIAELLKHTAGDEVVVQVPGCADAHIGIVGRPDARQVSIVTDAAMVVDESGDELGTTEDFSNQGTAVE